MKRAIAFIVLMLFLMLAAGCVSQAEAGNSSSKLPWSRPASWEGQTLGVPY